MRQAGGGPQKRMASCGYLALSLTGHRPTARLLYLREPDVDRAPDRLVICAGSPFEDYLPRSR